MLAYAASRPTIAARRSSPHTFLLIGAAHVVAIAALISAKMDLPRRLIDHPIIVDLIKARPQDPVAVPPKPLPELGESHSASDREVNGSRPRSGDSDLADPIGPGPIAIDPFPRIDPFPKIDTKPMAADRGASLDTPQGELKPPYPFSKLAMEEEASLTLKLTIGANGRVVAVEPVGRADPVFLDAARRHLLAHWRYRPAIKDGQAVTSTLITTLHFRLDG